MDTNTDRIFRQLIANTKALVQACNIAGNTLSEEFRGLITGPVAAVEEVLKECPDEAWDGVFRLDDCEQEAFTPDIPGYQVSRNQGARLRHLPSGKNATSYSADTYEENVNRAANALKKMVER